MPYSELSIPFLLINSDMTAQLQQSSIYDWAQSQHHSAAIGTVVESSTISYFRLNGQCLPL